VRAGSISEHASAGIAAPFCSAHADTPALSIQRKWGHLAPGEDTGTVLFYSLSSLQEISRISNAHERPCVSAMIHPSGKCELVLTASGTRYFPDYDVESPSGSRSPTPEAAPPQKRRRSSLVNKLPRLDNSVRVWRLAWKGEDSGGSI